MTIAINASNLGGVTQFLSAMQSFVSEVSIATDGQRGGWTMRIISDDIEGLASYEHAKYDAIGGSAKLVWYGRQAGKWLNGDLNIWEE